MLSILTERDVEAKSKPNAQSSVKDFKFSESIGLENAEESRKPLSTAEISFLQEKKSHAMLLMLAILVAEPFACALFYVQARFWTDRIILMTIMTFFYSIFFCLEMKKFVSLNHDIRGSHKSIFTAEIEGFKQNVHTNRSGDYTHSECCLFLRGEKYRVKGKDFFKFGEGDLVMVEAARQSKYVFSVEKIRH